MSHQPTSAPNTYHIRSCHPTEGDWLQVTLDRGAETPRMFLERVILWALVEGPHTVDRIEAITSKGTPRAALGATAEDHYLVRYGDRSPLEDQTWGQLYESITPSPLAVHEVPADQVQRLLAAG